MRFRGDQSPDAELADESLTRASGARGPGASSFSRAALWSTIVLCWLLVPGCAPPDQKPNGPEGKPSLLSITKSHTGDLTQGRAGQFVVTVRNTSSGIDSTSGQVEVSETLPAGLQLVRMSGNGWTCPGFGGSATCDRSDALGPGSTYPPITVDIRVAPDATSPQINDVAVSGGGSADDFAEDKALVDDPSGARLPTLSIKKTHAGDFPLGQQGQYTVSVSNDATAGPSRGTVTVTEAPPAGETLLSLSGTGWTCPAGGTTCTRGDPLAAGASYPPIQVVVQVAANAASTLVNTVTLSGGGSATVTASDSTTIASASLSITKSHTGTFTQGQHDALYSVIVSNAAGAGTTQGTVTVTEAPPTGLSVVSMSGVGWLCPAGGATCTRADALAPGAQYPPITVNCDVASVASSPRVNQVSVSGGGSASSSASDSTIILPNSPLVGVTLIPSTAVAPVGKTIQFQARASKQDGTQFDVTTEAAWSSSDASIATVTQDGAVTGIVASPQPVSIRATYGGFTGQASVSVTSAVLVSISVQPSPATVAVGAQLPLAATGTWSDGLEHNITPDVFWTSEQPGIATVSNVSGGEGIVTGLAPSLQPIKITATDSASGISGSTELTVTARPGLGTFLQYVTIAFDGRGLADFGTSAAPVVVDASGRFVLFQSSSTNLRSSKPTNQTVSVYLRDLSCIPSAQSCVPTQLESVTPAGEQAAGPSVPAGLSSDGSIAAFSSGAPNLTSRGYQVFEITGSSPPTVQAESLNGSGQEVDNASCSTYCGQDAAMSRTGRFTSFASVDPTLVAGNTQVEAYVHDSCLGAPSTPRCAPSTVLISATNAGAPVSTGAVLEYGFETTFAISVDGRIATFLSAAPELGGPANQTVLWVRDLQASTTTLVSVSPGGQPLLGLSASISDDGRYVTFVGIDWVTGLQGVYRRDLGSGTTAQVAANATSSGHALSSSGRFVAFVTSENPLNIPDLPFGQHGYVTDLLFTETHLVSVDSGGIPVEVSGSGMAISGDGSRVVYAVVAPDNTLQLAVALTGF